MRKRFDISCLLRRLAVAAVLPVLAGCGALPSAPTAERDFILAVIPDTQNMVDYRHQKAAGFKFDANDLFIGEMRYLADNARSAGGKVAFVAAVGDVWQHQTAEMEADHAARGHHAMPNPYFSMELEVSPKARTVEMPAALAGYRLLDGRVPFGVAPGNHDYDAMWADARFPPVSPQELGKFMMAHPQTPVEFRPDLIGMLHIGGLDNFRSVFGADSTFFKGKDWYVASYHGGADSAQIFSAGGYTFLHIALEMQPDDDVLAWADGVMAAHRGLPTIVTTHDYLNSAGERRGNPIVDLKRIDDRHNDPEDLWQKLIRRHDQIFLVLCGHQRGQAMRVDTNTAGHQVVQILADYQDRGQSAVDAGVPPGLRGRPVPIGDGWLRLMHFDFAGAVPSVQVKTYSPHYRRHSGETPDYAKWYKAIEQPAMSDADFFAADDYRFTLPDFRDRFGPPR